MNTQHAGPAGKLLVTEPTQEEGQQVLSPEALDFLTDLERRFRVQRSALLGRRERRQLRLDAGELPAFLEETAELRAASWSIAGIPSDLLDRRVEITGPVDAKMIINALNSGASVFMADFEDAHSPGWRNTLQGQKNLYDAVRRSLEYISPEGRHYRLNERPATLMVRPRGWHLEEKHLLMDGEPVSASLFDFGLFLFHNARRLLDRGSGPYFYLPKLEGRLEARLWNDVFGFAEEFLSLPRGSIKCTVLIETLHAAFEMDEILFELRDYIVGLNCGRWDYIFSIIKAFRNHPDWVLPDRGQLTMERHFLRSYSRLLIKTCHRRGAYAMGGMAAQIPIKNDPEADARARGKVRLDKEREAGDGHDGTWVAHPGLVPVAREVFDRLMPGPNQLHRALDEINVEAADLLRRPEGTITESGVRNNISAALHYMAAWLAGRGAVPIHNLMEDAATAEIARAQLWQWIRYPQGVMEGGRKITRQLFRDWLEEELEVLPASLDEQALGFYQRAATLLRDGVEGEALEAFFTLTAYRELP